MKSPDRPPVPPLTDAAVSRIERGVFANLDREAAEQRLLPARAARPRRRWPAVAVTSAALAAMVVLGVRQLRRPSEGPARGARIATATSPSHLTLEGAAVDVAPASAIDFVDDRDGATVIRLDRGSVTCEVAPRGTRPPFVVEAGATRVKVIGTRFGVTRIGDHARVWVVHGTVEVGDEGLTQLVHAGEQYLPGAGAGAGTVTARADPRRDEAPPGGAVTPGPPPTVPSPDPTPARAASAVAPPLSVPPHASPAPPPSTPAYAEAPAVGISGGARPPSLPERRHRTAAPTQLALRAPPASRPERSAPAMPTPAAAAEAPPAAVVARPPTPPAAPPPGAALRERFEAAAGLELRDPAAAFRIYRELAGGSGPWAANALFAQARLSAERGQREAARGLLAGYLERFPRGPNADDARALLTRLTGRSDGSRR